MRHPSALLWRLGVALGTASDLEPSSLVRNPAAWISANINQISAAIIKQESRTLSIDDIPGLERMLFPRLTLYMYGRSKLIGGSVDEGTSDGLLERHTAEWTSPYDIPQLSLKAVQEILRKRLVTATPLNHSEIEYLNDVYRLDILSIAARVLVVISGIKHIEPMSGSQQDLQNIINLLQALLDFGHLGDAYHPVLEALLTLSRKCDLHPESLLLKGVKMPPFSVETHQIGKVFKGSFGGKDVAIKCTKAFVKGADLWRQIDHPNVLSIYGLHAHPENPRNDVYLVSPWMSNGNIVQYLDKNTKADRMSLVLDVASGLQYLHNFKPMIIHGNLKVENILINGSLKACITDYGFTSTPDVPDQTTTSLEGQSNTAKTPAVDIYAFSTVFYEILMKCLGFQDSRAEYPDSVRFQPSKLSRPFLFDDYIWQLMQRCWSVEPNSRPTIDEVVRQLSHYLNFPSPSTVSPSEDSSGICNLIRAHRPSIFDLADLPVAISLPVLLDEGESSPHINPKDIIIVVMGPSGSGKSSFINQLFGRKVAQAHTKLESCTQTVGAFACMHPRQKSQKVIIVDTPGFDDSTRTDYEILEEIAQWLETTYRQKILLSGILQFHSIRDSRMRGTPRRNLAMFQHLCGQNAFKNVVLLTTFWDQVSDEAGARRETQLREEFWWPLITHGSRVNRFDPPAHERAWAIIDQFSPADARAALTIQTEIVDENRKLYETSVFKALMDFWTLIVNKFTGKARNANEVVKETQRAQEQKKALEKQLNSPVSSTPLKAKWFRRPGEKSRTI